MSEHEIGGIWPNVLKTAALIGGVALAAKFAVRQRQHLHVKHIKETVGPAMSDRLNYVEGSRWSGGEGDFLRAAVAWCMVSPKGMNGNERRSLGLGYTPMQAKEGIELLQALGILEEFEVNGDIHLRLTAEAEAELRTSTAVGKVPDTVAFASRFDQGFNPTTWRLPQSVA